ncbi:MAG: hypothetical protein KJN83_02520 [Nitrosopumilus sp.]|uniref:hypothetical protein n=1 Tax=Nitrosopumilus sp. b3 TaxID=2109909 RepID=UPI0015F66F4B|nr:hypothetical protein [Nitrosopumilus sp. b3]KAF6247559.1 hypothetical protein C6990_03665 [Nitrosopumilus sp. b3]MBT8172918.1 hypothetical protein [Nitrosopumilus sp.]
MVKTPADKWKDTIVKYRKQCQSILKISKNIRYAGVVNAYGRTLTGMVKPNLKPLLKSEQVKNEFFIISTLMSLRKETVSTVGKLEHVILQHQKVTIVILQKNNVTFYVSIDRKEKGLDKILSSIKKVI